MESFLCVICFYLLPNYCLVIYDFLLCISSKYSSVNDILYFIQI